MVVLASDAHLQRRNDAHMDCAQDGLDLFITLRLARARALVTSMQLKSSMLSVRCNCKMSMALLPSSSHSTMSWRATAIVGVSCSSLEGGLSMAATDGSCGKVDVDVVKPCSVMTMMMVLAS